MSPQVKAVRWTLAGASGPAVLVVASLLLASSPAAAYAAPAGGFADGTDSATATFYGAGGEQAVGALRLPTNTTVLGGSVLVSGAYAFQNVSRTDTTTSDLASNSLADGVAVSAGSFALAATSALLTLNASNGFGNASLMGCASAGAGLVISGGLSCTLTSENLTAPLGGWGNLLASANLTAGATLTVSLLDPTGAVVVASQALGGVVALDSLAVPTVRVRATLTQPAPGPGPALWWLTLGQRAGDTTVGSGVSRTETNLVRVADGSFTLGVSASSFTRYSGNPVLSTRASTYYSQGIASPFVLNVSGGWWAYFDAWSCGGCQGVIGRAVSADGVSWTIGASPLLTSSGGTWDSVGLGGSFVMANPAGSGYIMYVNSGSSNGTNYILRALSPDGVTWTVNPAVPVLFPTNSTWDSGAVLSATVRYANGTWTMWYHGRVGTNGGMDFGVATSSDGVNWTKYASNPVLTRGPCCGDDYLQVWQGDLLDWNGVTNFYYSCGSSVFKICLATSSGGYAWTKRGVVLSAGGGWEGSHVHDAAAVVMDGHPVLYYVGESTTWQVGRADADWTPGTLHTTVDFGARAPFTLTDVRLNGSANGGRLSAFVRSSQDGTSWSPYENITGRASVGSTPAARFIDWLVTLDGATGSAAPALRDIETGYTVYRAQGRYVSDAFAFNGSITSVNAALAISGAPGGVTLELSTDGGTSWTPATGGVPVAFAPTGSSLLYAVGLEGTTNATPRVDSVSLVVEVRSLPRDVTVRAGAGSVPFLDIAGDLVGARNVSLPADVLNAAIALARQLTPSATAVDLQLLANSTRLGAITLSEPRLTLQFKNPLMAAFEPPGASLAGSEAEVAHLAINASTLPGVPLNYSWWLDGVLQGQSGPSFDWTTTYDDAGNHTVTGKVENGDFVEAHNWTVAVADVNRPPVFSDLVPGNATVSASYRAAVDFSANATDPEGRALTFVWRVDRAVAQAGTARSFSVTALGAGPHTVQVAVSDDMFTVVHNWTLELTDSPPTATFAPEGPVVLSHGASAAFTVVASDPDGDPLAYRWWLDGVAQTFVDGASFDLLHPATGGHTVNVSVLAGGQAVNRTWQVTSTNAPPEVLGGLPALHFSASSSAALVFNVTAADADNDALSYAWTVDGAVQAERTDTLVAPSTMGPGTHTVRVTVSDMVGGSASKLWSFEITSAGLTQGPGFDLVFVLLVALGAAAVVLLVQFLRGRPGEPPAG